MLERMIRGVGSVTGMRSIMMLPEMALDGCMGRVAMAGLYRAVARTGDREDAESCVECDVLDSFVHARCRLSRASTSPERGSSVGAAPAMV